MKNHGESGEQLGSVLALKAVPATLGACHDIVLYVAGVPVQSLPGRITDHCQVLQQVRYTQDCPTAEVCWVTNGNVVISMDFR